MSWVARKLRRWIVGGCLVCAGGTLPFGDARAQAPEAEIERPGPPKLDDMETDANHDFLPDSWYNARDAQLVDNGGQVGPHFLRIECNQPGRPARISRAFGVDGRKTEAMILGLWIRQSKIQMGERQGEEPGLMIDFLGNQLDALRRASLGPWTRSVGSNWTRVVKRFAVHPGTRDVIISVGLMGATGTLDIDGLTVELVPRDGVAATTNLVANGDFELGDPSPAYWLVDPGAKRVHVDSRSSTALELVGSGAWAQIGLAMPVSQFESLDVQADVRFQGLRGSGGARATFFFFNEFGDRLQGPGRSVSVFNWSGSTDWRTDEVVVRVPPGAVRAVLQLQKADSQGSFKVDNVIVSPLPNPEAGSWTPYHVEEDVDGWLPVPSSPRIAPNSALDVSFLIPKPAGAKGFVSVKNKRLAVESGERIRFLGVTTIPPTAFLEPDKAEELADRLARSGINLVRLGELDTALGPNRSLFDDSRDDTKAFDPEALSRLDHLIAELKKRGIYFAIELQSNRRFRVEDKVSNPGLLPPGGGPAALIDPTLKQLSLDAARKLLAHVNPETGLALKDDPALAWVTLAGEMSLFDQIDRADSLPVEFAKELRRIAENEPMAAGRRLWQTIESNRWHEMAESLRKDSLRAPIAGVSHWRREREFNEALAAPGLNLIDDRLYWSPPPWVSPEFKSLLWSVDGGLVFTAERKRRVDRPYVVGHWCPLSLGAWSFPLEAGDQLLVAQAAISEDWDALVRRGVFLFPLTWGEGAVGTIGGEDVFQIGEVVNGSPHVFALWPHQASIMLRGHKEARNKGRATAVPGWDPTQGRFVVNTPFTQGISGWFQDESESLGSIDISTRNPFAVIVSSSVTPEPIAQTKRLLVTAIARLQPTGFRWVDGFKRDVADPGQAPLLQEPVTARVVWRRSGKIKAYTLNNAGERVGKVKLEPLDGDKGVALDLDGRTAAFHWELVVE